MNWPQTFRLKKRIWLWWEKEPDVMHGWTAEEKIENNGILEPGETLTFSHDSKDCKNYKLISENSTAEFALEDFAHLQEQDAVEILEEI